MASVVGRKGALDHNKPRLAKHLPIPHHETAAGMLLWRRFALFGALPCVALLTFKTVMELSGHDAHHSRPEFVPYEHLRIRNKRFPWGDGQRSLFHNPETNPLPTGYEK